MKQIITVVFIALYISCGHQKVNLNNGEVKTATLWQENGYPIHYTGFYTYQTGCTDNYWLFAPIHFCHN